MSKELKRLDTIAQDLVDFLENQNRKTSEPIWEGTMFISNTPQQSYDTIFYRINTIEDLNYLLGKITPALEQTLKENFLSKFDPEDLNYLIVQKGKKHLFITG